VVLKARDQAPDPRTRRCKPKKRTRSAREEIEEKSTSLPPTPKKGLLPKLERRREKGGQDAGGGAEPPSRRKKPSRRGLRGRDIEKSLRGLLLPRIFKNKGGGTSEKTRPLLFSLIKDLKRR